MIPSIDIKADGFERLDKELQRFKADIKTKARRAGLVEMAKPIKKTLKSSIPVGSGYDNTGALQNSVGHAAVPKGFKSALGLKTDDEAIIVGSTRKVLDSSGTKRFQHFKLHFLDKGTRPHIIKAKRGGVLSFKGLDVKKVNHPGIAARGILQNAYNAHKSEYSTLWERGAARALKRYEAKAI